MPEDLFTQLNGEICFAKIDLSGAFLKLEKSKEILTINFHKGSFRFKHLSFGSKQHQLYSNRQWTPCCWTDLQVFQHSLTTSSLKMQMTMNFCNAYFLFSVNSSNTVGQADYLSRLMNTQKSTRAHSHPDIMSRSRSPFCACSHSKIITSPVYNDPWRHSFQSSVTKVIYFIVQNWQNYALTKDVLFLRNAWWSHLHSWKSVYIKSDKTIPLWSSR